MFWLWLWLWLRFWLRLLLSLVEVLVSVAGGGTEVGAAEPPPIPHRKDRRVHRPRLGRPARHLPSPRGTLRKKSGYMPRADPSSSQTNYNNESLHGFHNYRNIPLHEQCIPASRFIHDILLFSVTIFIP